MIRRITWTDGWIATGAAAPIATAFLTKGLALLVLLRGLGCAPRASRGPLRHAGLLLAARSRA